MKTTLLILSAALGILSFSLSAQAAPDLCDSPDSAEACVPFTGSGSYPPLYSDNVCWGVTGSGVHSVKVKLGSYCSRGFDTRWCQIGEDDGTDVTCYDNEEEFVAPPSGCPDYAVALDDPWCCDSDNDNTRNYENTTSCVSSVDGYCNVSGHGYLVDGCEVPLEYSSEPNAAVECPPGQKLVFAGHQWRCVLEVEPPTGGCGAADDDDCGEGGA